MLRILLPTDFSENSFNAIKYALLAFKDTTCKFHLLHTYMPPIYQSEFVAGSPGQIGLGASMKENVVSNLDKLQKSLENEHTTENHSFETHACLNTLTGQIDEIVKDRKIDVIIMGTKGASGAKEILFGTHTVHILKNAKCPVIAIPPDFEYESPKAILFPTDYEVGFKKEPLKVLFKIIKQHNANIDVINVSYAYKLSETQMENKGRLEKALKNTPHEFHDLPNQDLTDAINKFQLAHKIDLLVMIKNKHTFVERLFIEPVIKKIGFHIKIPFMVIPDFQD